MRRDLLRRLYGGAIDYPRLTLAAAALVLCAFLPGLARLELETGGRHLTPSSAPEVVASDALNARYGVGDQLVVVVEDEGAQGIYRPETLRLLAELTSALESLPGIGAGRVRSLADEKSDRVYPGTLDFRPWLDPFPEDAGGFERLRRDVEEFAVYDGALVSRDHPASAAAILVEVERSADRDELARRAEALLDVPLPSGVRTHLVGAPVAESRLGRHLLEDLVLLVPLSLALLALVFWLAFRSLPAVALPLLEVGPCLLMTFGLAGWLGVPVYLTMTIIPVILVAVGVADELHLFTAFERRRREVPGEGAAASARAAFDELARPVLRTSLTTAVGFLSFGLSPIAPVRSFGLFMAFGVLLCLSWSLTVIPACLALPAFGRLGDSARSSRLEALAARLGPIGLRWRWPVLLLALAGLACAPLGVVGIVVQDSWVGGFAEGSSLRRSTARVDELFGGTHLLRVEVDARAVEGRGTISRDDVEAGRVRLPGLDGVEPARIVGSHLRLELPAEGASGRRQPAPLEGVVLEVVDDGGERWLVVESEGFPTERWLPPRATEVDYALDARERLLQEPVLARVAELEAFLADQEELGVGRVLGPAEHVATMGFALSARQPGSRRLPESAWRARQVVEHYAKSQGEERLREVLDEELAAGLVTVFLAQSNYEDTARLLERLGEFAARRLEPVGLSLELGGDVAVSQAMIRGIVQSQVLSLLLSLLGVGLVTSLLNRSVAWGVVCALPAACAVLVVFACMGGLSIPLGVATSMFAATVLGIGTDYAIHFVECLRARLTEGRARGEALVQALGRTAPAIVVDALAIGGAFGLLLVSRVPANARLGGLVALCVAACLVATLVVLPALLSFGWPTVARRARR